MNQTCGVDAGRPVGSQDEVAVAVAEDARLHLMAVAALTVTTVLHRADEDLPVRLHTCTHIDTHTQGRARIHTQTGTHTQGCARRHTGKETHTQARRQTCTHTNIHTNRQPHTHTRADTYTHMHAHTHKGRHAHDIKHRKKANIRNTVMQKHSN